MNYFTHNTRLVDYSSDEESDEHEVKNINTYIQKNTLQITKTSEPNISNRKQCDILPLPSEIKCMYADSSKDNVTDDPKSHGGKIRSFPHERGMWPTYVYVEYVAIPEFLKMIEDLKSVSKSHGIILSSLEDFHVSLSRTLKLRYEWIQAFIDSLKIHLSHFFKFKIMFQSLEVYENEEKTRTFVGVKANFGYDNLCKITKKVDEALTEYKLPLFYEDPSFHLSCSACVGSKAAEIELFMADLNAVFQSFAESHPTCRSLWVKEIYCKIGNRLFTFQLKS